MDGGDSFVFSARKNANGSWTVNRDGSQTFVIETGDDDTSLVLRFKYAVQIGDSFKAFDVQWRTNIPQGPWSSGCFDGAVRGSIFDTVVISTTITGLKPRTTYQVRYRDTNTDFCIDTSSVPDSWSTIVEGTTSGETP